MKFLILSLLLSLNLSGIDFNKDIKPILAKNCFSCHGKEKQKGKLRLDTFNESRKILKKNNKGSNILLDRIFHIDEEEIMPPLDKGTLTNSEKNILTEWIENGAIYTDHWSFIPLKKVKVPEESSPWIKNNIDQFTFSKMKSKNLSPNEVKFDYKLLRRLSFITTGLPPDNTHLEQLNKNELKYEKILDEYLNSESFGEHWAAFWLDGARYGDTNGIEYDFSRPIWPYRDWVIKAFNDNMPYDQFLTEQIAGDLLPNATSSQKVATGFLRCNVSTNEMGSIEEEFKIRYAKDRLNTTATVFMGLTVKCAECHDHKYDPVSQKEYYQLMSFFNNIDGKAVGLVSDRADAPTTHILSPVNEKKLAEAKQQLIELSSKMKTVKEKSSNDFWWWHYQKLAAPPKDIFIMGKLESYFPLNETAGSHTFNLMNENRCNVKGSIYRQKGKSGMALEFKGSSFIDCLKTGSFTLKEPMSLGFWIFPKEDAEGTIAAKHNLLKNRGWKATIKNKKVNLQISHNKSNALIIETKNELPENQWSHIAFTLGQNKNECNVYVNGKISEQVILQNNLTKEFELKNNMRIGYEAIGEPLTECVLDDVFTSKKLLGAEDINQIKDFIPESRFILIPPKNLSRSQKKVLHDYYLTYFDKNYVPLFKESARNQQKIEAILESSPKSLIMKEKDSPQDTHILKGGHYLNKGEIVTSQTPVFLTKIQDKQINRLSLAKWLTSPKHPLTPRVYVNKIWMQIFGNALVDTPDDFGIQGSYPTHPQLLDYLSNFLIDNDWDTKKLIKHILMSSTFRQTSKLMESKLKIDKGNKYLSFYSPRRLSSEMIRDQILKVSGKIYNKVGGSPVFPYQPLGLWANTTATESDTKLYVQSTGKENYRRSIYTFWKRNLPPPTMILFDSPTRQTCIVQRQLSNTPLQALALLNDPQFTVCYEDIAEKIKKSSEPFDSKINNLYLEILKRPPDSKEIDLCKSFIKRGYSWTSLVSSLINLNEFISLE